MSSLKTPFGGLFCQFLKSIELSRCSGSSGGGGGGRADAPNFKRFRKQQFRPSQIVATVKPSAASAAASDNGGALMRWIEENEPPAQKTTRTSPRKPWR